MPPTTPPQYVTDPNQLELIQKINKEYEEVSKKISNIASAREALIKQLIAEEEKTQKIEQINKDIEKTLKQQGDYQQKINALKSEQQTIDDLSAKKIANTISTLEKQQLQAAKERAKTLEQETKDIEKKIEIEKNGVKKQMELEEKLAKARQEDIKKQGEALKALGALATKAGDALLEGFNFPLLGIKIKGLREITTDVIKAPAEAFKKFGFLDQYSQSLDNMRESMLGAGVGEMQMREALGDLNQTVSDFPNYSKGLQESLIDTSSRLSLAGFNSKTTAANFNNMIKVFGQTEQQANATNIKIAALSKSLGQGTKAMEDFVSLTPKLAGFRDGIDTFEKTAIAAKKLGMETQELFGIMDQYDSFEKAANAAGELNVALGGQFVDSLELMKASIEGGPTDTLNLLQKSLKDSGVQVENLSRSQLKYFAAAAGMKEDQFLKVFSKGGQGVQAYIVEQELAAKKQEDLNNIAKQTQDIFQQIQNEFNKAFGKKENIAMLVNIANKIKDMVISVSEMIKKVETLGKIFKSLVPIMSGLFAAGAVMSFIGALRTAGSLMAAFRATTLGAAIANAFLTGMSGYGIATVIAAGTAAVATGVAINAAMGGNSGDVKQAAGPVSAATNSVGSRRTQNITTVSAKEPEPVAKYGDALAPGGSMITTPQGGRMITDAKDSVIAAKDGGVLSDKLTEISSLLREYLERPVPVLLDGKKVNSELAKSNRYNPFIA